MSYKCKNKRKPNGFYSKCQGHEKPREQKLKEMFICLISKQGTKQDYMIQKQKHKN
jgi:hypothetical protein